MKKKLGIPENRPLADFLPTITITAKQLATEITNFNVKQHDLKGVARITDVRCAPFFEQKFIKIKVFS
jgi:DNA-damage-inducible protein D